MKRRDFVRSIGAATAALAAGAIQAAPAKPPNFVFFLTDDLGWGDLGCFGSDFHETPNLDRLCAEGMKFNQAYSACTVCSPSRAAIMTGKYPARTHITDWIAGHRKPFAKLAVPDWQMYLGHDEITIAEALKDAGYATQFAGKWHLTKLDPELREDGYPDRHGFDGNAGGREWGQPKGKGKYFHPWDMPGLDGGKEGDYLTDRLADEAEAFIDAEKDKPFFLYMSFYAVHGPIMCKPELLKKYKDKLAAKPDTIQNNPAYAGMIESVDDCVGRIMARLRAHGLDDNTVVIFTGDNGGVRETSSGGLRGAKGYSHEGGTREPTIVKWPGGAKAGSQCDTPIIGMDFYPTMLDIAGLPARPKQHVDGLSIVPLLKQRGGLDRDTLYWHYPHYHKTMPYGAIRDKDWKLIEFFEEGDLELYNLEADPAESNNLAQSMPEKAQELLTKMRKWRKDVGAQMMTPNPNHDPSRSKQNPKQRAAAKEIGASRTVQTPLGKVTASSAQRGNAPENAADGKDNTRWAANGEAVPQWWQVELDAARDINGVRVLWQNTTARQYKIETSLDGKTWTTAVDELKSEEVRARSVHKFTAKVKFLKITVERVGKGWVSFKEFELI